jgi:hypothetical protein
MLHNVWKPESWNQDSYQFQGNGELTRLRDSQQADIATKLKL